MSGWDRFIMVDWSGGNDTGPLPRKDAIWIGSATTEGEAEPLYLRNRAAAFDWLSSEIDAALDAQSRVFIGFDFPFGYPQGFARVVTGSDDPLGLWEYFADAIEDGPHANNRFTLAGALNRRFPGVGPFWFNARKADIADLPRKGRDRQGHGMTERRACETLAKGTFTCWQMGGAGAVGGQVMTGLAVLQRLRQRFPGAIGVWPFDLADHPIAFVEIWPSILAKQVAAEADPIKDRAQVRLMARALARLPRTRLSRMLAVDAPEEGWILGLGHEEALRTALC